MKALRVTLVVVASLLILILAAAVIAPKDYEVTRSLSIEAAAPVLYPYISQLKKMDSWSPWSVLDSNQVKTYEGTDGTPGAITRWSGNDDVGSGWQELKSLTPNRVDYDVHFLQPFESSSNAFLTLQPEGKRTTVTWGFTGKMPMPWNVMGIFMNMEKAVGADFEKGLGLLKAMVEAKSTKTLYEGYEVSDAELPLTTFVGVRKQLSWDQVDPFMKKEIPRITALIAKAGLKTGVSNGLYFVWDEATKTTDMAAVMEVPAGTKIPGLEIFELKGRFLEVNYKGTYDKSFGAYQAMDDYLADRNLHQGAPVREEYVVNPDQEPDSTKWLMRIFMPVAE